VVFRGINLIQLDNKGRMAMPAKYRARLEELAEGRLIVTVDTQETCLLLYPLPEWELIEKKIEDLPSFHKITRRIQRLLIGHATELELDGNGRILLPTLLREYAKLDKQAMLIGQGKKFEIWNESDWQAKRNDWLKEEAENESLPEELKSFSL
jgi:MraZ protein